MRRAGRGLPSAVTMLSCAGGASLFVGESSRKRTPEMIRTVAVACTAADTGTLGAGVAATIAAEAASQSMRVRNAVGS
jgi:hypothetical protein